jgi:hypothetical protein
MLFTGCALTSNINKKHIAHNTVRVELNSGLRNKMNLTKIAGDALYTYIKKNFNHKKNFASGKTQVSGMIPFLKENLIKISSNAPPSSLFGKRYPSRMLPARLVKKIISRAFVHGLPKPADFFKQSI